MVYSWPPNREGSRMEIYYLNYRLMLTKRLTLRTKLMVNWLITNKSKGIVVILAGFLMLTGCQNDKSTATGPKPTVSVITVAQSKIPITKQYIGISQSIASIGIRARVEGFLTEMNFIEGKPVKKGQLLFVIDPRPYQAQLDSAKGQLAKSIAIEEYQQVQFLRLKQLVAQGNISKSQYDEIVASYHSATAQVAVDRAQVENAAINLSYCYMYSPVDGIVGKRYVDVGNLVGGSEQTLLAYVVKLDPIFIQFSPSVVDYNQFLTYRENMPFNAEASFPNNKDISLSGKVDLLNNQADTSTSTIFMRATIENPEKLVLPNVYMNLNVTLSQNGQVILIPASATIENQGKRAVYIVNKSNQIESRSIVISGQYGEQYIVQSGLSLGDLVVTSGVQRIRPEQEVNVTMTSN